jgi:hypothetical protein
MTGTQLSLRRPAARHVGTARSLLSSGRAGAPRGVLRELGAHQDLRFEAARSANEQLATR